MRGFVFSFLIFLNCVSLIHAQNNPWENIESFDSLNSKLQVLFPLLNTKAKVEVDLISYEGWKGRIANREMIGDEFFCDFQLKKDYGHSTLIRKGREFLIEDVRGYMASDLEISRIGIILKLSQNTLEGEDNPFDFLICIRNQQRDQIKEGWTLEKESHFSVDDVKDLLKDKVLFSLAHQ